MTHEDRSLRRATPAEGQRDRPVGTRPSPGDLTLFLNQIGRGGDEALATLMPIVVEELRAIAQIHFQGSGGAHTLQPTALVNEVFLKLFDPERVDWNDRHHFFALAAKAMRQLMVDHARRRGSEKRGRDRRQVTLDEAFAHANGIEFDLLDLDLALTELAALDERQARVVELRYFGGAQVGEIAGALQVSVSTVEREWRAARAWLGHRLASSP